MKSKKTKIKIPKGFTYNPDLDKYKDVVLFKEKLERANQILKVAKLPKI
jgi:hypothetical protein